MTCQFVNFNSLHAWYYFFHAYAVFCWFFSKLTFSRNPTRVSNCSDPDQDQPSVSPDLGPNFLRRISVDDKSLLAKNELYKFGKCSKILLLFWQDQRPKSPRKRLLLLIWQTQQKSSAFLVCWNALQASVANSVDPDQTAPIGAVCSGSTLFASILNSSVMLGNYLQQTTSAEDFFRCIFSWRFKG